ncbi:hypothetical protein F2Q70_00016545 [Brassica cretica]|uniref:Uncharacterized protein n=1 Tax=Brassica cretica TaxID=69181 RepID=A0A8S9I3Q1_BRACR|nr:hypothetical protein F2Q70_00016545 [Brassica cretica]KAF2597145.1 hypothetical protein F2Q68_00009503 [Brassica cretica]
METPLRCLGKREMCHELRFQRTRWVSIKVFIAAISEPRSFNGTEAEPLVIKIDGYDEDEISLTGAITCDRGGNKAERALAGGDKGEDTKYVRVFGDQTRYLNNNEHFRSKTVGELSVYSSVLSVQGEGGCGVAGVDPVMIL